VLAPGRLQYGFDQKGGRAFSVRAGNSSISNALGRTLVEIRAQAGKRTAPMHDLRPANRRARRFGRGRLIDEPFAVAGLTLHGKKNSPRAPPPRIVFHPSNGRVSALRENLGALQELLECHWVDYK